MSARVDTFINCPYLPLSLSQLHDHRAEPVVRVRAYLGIVELDALGDHLDGTNVTDMGSP